MWGVSEKHSPLPGDMSDRTIGKAALFFAGMLAITVMMIITLIPSYALLLLLNPDYPASIINALAVAAAMALAGPAFSAGMYAARAQAMDENPSATRAFWRGYRMNFFDVLRIWLPISVLVGLLFLAMGVANLTGLGIGNVALLAITLVVVLWGFHALTLSTFISMSPGGIARLALLYLGRTWKVTLGVVGILLIAVLLAYLPGGVFLVGIFAGVLAFLFFYNAKPMIDDATEHYTVSGAAPHDAVN